MRTRPICTIVAALAGLNPAQILRPKSDCAIASPTAEPRRCSVAGNRKRGIVLQRRDLHLLSEVGVMRIIDREMVKMIAGFKSTTSVNIRLLALTRAGLLRRFFVGSIAH